MTDTNPISFRLAGPDTAIARLIADLEMAGAEDVHAEADERPSDDLLDPQHFHGTITGLSLEEATKVAARYLATVSGEQIWLGDDEIQPET